MSAKYDKIADRINYTPGTDVSSGDIVSVGGLIGVATADIASGDVGDLAIVGQFEIDLASGQTFSAGDAVYVDASSEAHASTGSFFGWAVEDSDSDTDTVKAVLVQSVSDDVS
jgi:predicted RecA/RadA family phage recombinase